MTAQRQLEALMVAADAAYLRLRRVMPDMLADADQHGAPLPICQQLALIDLQRAEAELEAFRAKEYGYSSSGVLSEQS